MKSGEISISMSTFHMTIYLLILFKYLNLIRCLMSFLDARSAGKTVLALFIITRFVKFVGEPHTPFSQLHVPQTSKYVVETKSLKIRSLKKKKKFNLNDCFENLFETCSFKASKNFHRLKRIG